MRLSLFSSKQCIIKQLLDSVFVISGIIKVSARVISLSLRLRLITLTSTLIIPDITKTSSNNCLKSNPVTARDCEISSCFCVTIRVRNHMLDCIANPLQLQFYLIELPSVITIPREEGRRYVGTLL